MQRRRLVLAGEEDEGGGCGGWEGVSYILPRGTVSYPAPPRVGWRNFFPVVLLCQFLVLAGNRFWCYLLGMYVHMYLEYNTVVVLC